MFAVAFAVLAAGAIVLTLNVLLLVCPSSPYFSLLAVYHNANTYKIGGSLTCKYLVMTVMFGYRVGTSSSSKA